MATAAARTPILVYLEAGKKRVFADAADWPGWCRSAKTEALALEALAAAADRYADVARRAGLPPPPPGPFDIVERLPGSATTDFGAPAARAAGDLAPVSAADARRLAALVGAAWEVFDEIVAATGPSLEKGPRGGGRDRDEMVRHVLAAIRGDASMIGVKHPVPGVGDTEAIRVLRHDIVARLSQPSDGSPLREKGWPLRWAARRMAWHVLDHAWEMQDKALSPR